MIFGSTPGDLSNKIDPLAKIYRQLPQGRPAIGFTLVTDLDVLWSRPVRCSEHRDGRLIGELSIEVFAAALIIDRDGILQSRASEAVGSPAIAFELAGVSGYRAETIVRGHALPYHHALAVAPEHGVDGGLLIAMRCAAPEWPRADELLRSLRLLTRGGRPAND